MISEGFPLPVTILSDEEGCLVVHRSVKGVHLDERHCWCCPTIFTSEEVSFLTTAQFNALLSRTH